MATILTNTLDKIATQAATVSAFAGRIYQGKARLADNVNLENLVRALTELSQGYLVFWPSARDSGSATEGGTVTVKGYALFRVKTNTTNTLNTVWDICEDLLDKIMDDTAMRAANSRAKAGAWSMEGEGLSDDILKVDFAITYEIGPGN